MKKKIIIMFLIIIAFLSYGVYWAFFDTGRLPTGKFISEMQSPNGDYTIEAYVIEPALSASAVRGELNYNKVKKKPKNIYWNFREDSANIKYIDNITVIINGHKLNILHDNYDWRRVKSFK